MVILPEYRRIGLGKKLLKRAESFAIEKGARVIRIDVLAKNASAAEMYRNVGFKDYEITLLKNLPPKLS